MNILIKDISSRNPQKIQSASDAFYGKLANSLYDKIKLIYDLPPNIVNNSLKEIVIKSVKYLEDVVSELGIWSSFRNLHDSLYGKKLPFYEINEEDYDDNDVNIEDVKYIVWSTIIETNENLILNPNAPALERLAYYIYDVLYDEFEKAPINHKVPVLLKDEAIYYDFMQLKHLLNWIYADCYLTSSVKSIEEIECTAEEFSEEISCNVDFAKYIVKSHFAVSSKTGPLALLAKDWLVALMRYHGLSCNIDKIQNIEAKPLGAYSLKKRKDTTLELLSEDGESYELEIDSIEQGSRKSVISAPAIIAQMAKFGDTWQLNGFCVEIDDFLPQKSKNQELLKEKTELLKKNANAKKIVFFKNYKELQQWFESLSVPVQCDELKNKKYIALFMDSDNEPTIIYSNVRAIYSEDNPYYDEKYAIEHAFELLDECFVPSDEFVSYMIKHGMLKDASIKTAHGRDKKIVQENLDFMARFLRRSNYYDIDKCQ